MNTLKNVLFFGLLLAVLCGVYLSLSHSPEATVPPGLSTDTSAPRIEIPDLKSGTLTPTSNQEAGGIPAFPSQPPITPPPPSRIGGDAPPWPQPTTTDQRTAAPSWPPPNSMTAPPPEVSTRPDTNYPPGVANPFNRRDAAGPPPSDPSLSGLPPPPGDPSPNTPPTSPLPLPGALSSKRHEVIMQQVESLASKRQFAEALETLSQLNGSAELSASQAQQVTMTLDQMAAKVIYSREHLLESPYLVQQGDTLETIAERYQVPALLLARINGIRDPRSLPPGKELKVLKGPFWAQMSTDRSEMTLMLGGRYAGRFNVVLSNDLSRSPNMCTVRDKRAPTAAAGNGTGKQWVELSSSSGNISMQGTNDTRVTTGSDSRSSIWLSEQDMDDVFGILSVGSRVIIQR